MFYQQLAAPKQIDKTAFVIRLFNGFFKAGNAAARDAKYIKKGIPKRFGFGILARFRFPFF
jgi:hypothetical protein